jgi:NADPH-dependent curcumin reductase CurA
MKNNQNIILVSLMTLFLFGCTKQESELTSSLGPEITCGLAEPFAESAIEMRQENVPKFIAKAVESAVFLFQDSDMDELHHKLQDTIDLAYEQEKVKSKEDKQKQLESFPQLAYEKCLESFESK